MRISVDGRHLGAGRGVARYARTLLRRMQDEFGSDEWEIVSPGRAHNAAAGAFGWPRIGGGADVVWLPAPAPVAIARDVPYVLTVHDLSWEARPQDFTPYERVWHRVARPRRLAERASLVIAVSEATRAEVAQRWGIEEGKIRVVRSGPGLTPDKMCHQGTERQPRRYFLAVGALEPRKDPVLLARAHALARGKELDAELWFAGAGRLAAAVEGEGVRVLGPQDDAALHELYANALALVHPALLEGFAFPPLEALAHGTPPILADIPVHRETVGDGALRFPPGDVDALADALLNIERDPSLRTRLVTAGQTAIAALSWDEAANRTHAALREATSR